MIIWYINSISLRNMMCLFLIKIKLRRKLLISFWILCIKFKRILGFLNLMICLAMILIRFRIFRSIFRSLILRICLGRSIRKGKKQDILVCTSRDIERILQLDKNNTIFDKKKKNEFNIIFFFFFLLFNLFYFFKYFF